MFKRKVCSLDWMNVAQPQNPVSRVTRWRWWCCLWADPSNPDLTAFVSEIQTHVVSPGRTLLLISFTCTSRGTHLPQHRGQMREYRLHKKGVIHLAIHLYSNPSSYATITGFYFCQKRVMWFKLYIHLQRWWFLHLCNKAQSRTKETSTWITHKELMRSFQTSQDLVFTSQFLILTCLLSHIGICI